MDTILETPSVSFEYAYTNYASQLYGMIFHSTQSANVSYKILEEIFTQIDYSTLEKTTAFFKLVCKTRQLITAYIKNNPAQFLTNHHYITNNTEISGEQLLELVYMGRYTILDIKEMTGIDENIIKQRLVVAIKNKVKINQVKVF